MSIQQKALLIPSKGAQFEIGSRPIPKPDPGQVLVKIHATAVNPVDDLMRTTGYLVDTYPVVVGFDAAGVIEELGEGVTSLQIGDNVFFHNLFFTDAEMGTFQQYTLSDAARTAKIPSNLSFEQASTIPLCFATAFIGMYGKKGQRGGAELFPFWEEGGRVRYQCHPAVVVGGASSVGQFAIQLAKLSGFSPIITTASSHNEAYCKEAGATHVIDYHSTPYSELPSAIAKVTSTPVLFVYDAISSEASQKAGWQILAPGGSIVVTVVPVVGKPGAEAEDGKHTAWVFGNFNREENKEVGALIYSKLTGLLAEGALKPNKVELLPNGLAGIPEGAARLANGKVSGVKLVARILETP